MIYKYRINKVLVRLTIICNSRNSNNKYTIITLKMLKVTISFYLKYKTLHKSMKINFSVNNNNFFNNKWIIVSLLNYQNSYHIKFKSNINSLTNNLNNSNNNYNFNNSSNSNKIPKTIKNHRFTTFTRK